MDSSRDSLPLPQAHELDCLADEFERAFSAGENPRIEQFCSNSQLPFEIVLGELVSLEFELLEKLGEPPDQSTYLARFPKHASVVDAAIDAAERRIST